jgi:hypothetical protein
MKPKNCNKDSKKKNLIDMDSINKVERILDVDENISFTLVQKALNLSSLRHKEEKEMKKLFHIKVQFKKTKVNALFDFGS